MRAGPFSEPRVINILNRRFVSYYFNTGGPGQGHSSTAKEFVREVENQYAFYAAFKPDGTYLGSTGLYADKNRVFDFLRNLLESNPEFASSTEEEERVLESSSKMEKVKLYEELGNYEEAQVLCESVDVDSDDRLEASFAGARMARYQGDWERHQRVLEALKASREFGPDTESIARFAIEEGYRLIAAKRYQDARKSLQETARKFDDSIYAAELHFNAGVACWFDEDSQWARFHWSWVLENREDDRLYMRARVAAADEAMHYPNFELGRTEVRPGQFGVSIPQIDSAVGRSLVLYEDLLPSYEMGRFEARLEAEPKEPQEPQEPVDLDRFGRTPGEKINAIELLATQDEKGESTDVLVRRLRDGNEYRVKNNVIVGILEKRGSEAIEALVSILEEPDYRGRGYAAWALANVMKRHGEKPQEALAMLERCTTDMDPYVVALSRSGMRVLGTSTASEEPRGKPAKSAFLIVAKLVDGNEHLVANNLLVAKLVKMRKEAIPSLLASIRDSGFPGRGYAAWALGSVLAELDDPPDDAVEALREAGRDEDPYVRTLARSGLSLLR